MVFSVLISVFFVSCARDEIRPARYDAKECPFCTLDKGVCPYCHGTKTCTFCDGKGTRLTVIPVLIDEKTHPTSYKEKCPYCNGKGVCRYCEGKGKCWACNGTAVIEDWTILNEIRK